jgi:rhamnosyltransferase
LGAGLTHAVKVAAVIVLYNPGEDVLENILSYIGQVDLLLAIDNSEEPSRELSEKIKNLPKAEYSALRHNAGIGSALNIAAYQCLEKGYDFLLTMDQDSKAPPDLVANMLDCLQNHDVRQVGIISPFHLLRTAATPPNTNCQQILTAMTSGNLLNLEVFEAIGPFMEELFIDYIDHEYCLRLNKHGYLVLQANSAVLKHSLGNIQIYNLWNFRFTSTHHSAFRRYFMTRNRFFVMNAYKREFPQYYRSQLFGFYYELLAIIFFEKEKLKKLANVIKGYRDFRKGSLPDIRAFNHE